MKKHLYLFLIFVFIYSSIFGADYFWVGNSGNWSDLTHWSNTSGGAGNTYLTLPTTTDNVFFDANSFAIPGQTVNLDVNAEADDLTLTGVTNSPTIDGDSNIILSIGGSLTFVSGFTHSFSGNYLFLSAASETITSANKTFNQNILFNGIGGTFTLVDNLSVINEIQIQNGTFNTSGLTVSSGSINANNGTALRAINFGASNVTITGTGTVLDLRGDTPNLSVIPGSSTITFSNADTIIVETGIETKTLPNLSFPNCATIIQINTNSVEDNTKRISFGDILVSVDGVTFSVDNNNDDSNIKTFASITLPNDCRYIIGSADGSGGFAGTNHTIISGAFIVGNDGEGDIRGDKIDFQGGFDAGTRSDCRFIRDAQFNDDFIVDGTSGGGIILDQDVVFSDDININGSATLRVDEDVNISGNINISNNIDVVFRNVGTGGNVAVNEIFIGTESTLDLGRGGVGPYNISGISMASGAQLDINNNSALTTIGDITLVEFNIVRFNTNASTNITGTLTSPGSCDIWLWLKSLTNGQQANVSFSSPQTTDFNICQDLNCTTSNFTNNNGVDLSNNSGISFPSTTSGTTFFWVGSTTGNNKMGMFSTGINDNWSNPDNWATSSGGYTANNTCIPGAQDDVIFDANSFTAGAGNIDIDLTIQACNNLTFTNIPTGCTMDAGLTNTDRELIIFGNTSLNVNLDNQYEGQITFSAIDVAARTITSNSSNFFGNVEFNFIGGNWSLVDNFDMNGGTNADISFSNGTVDANAITITIEDDWTVTNGTFTASTSTVEFDGPASQSSRQDITSNGNAFYNFLVNRGTNGGGVEDQVRMSDEMAINNDLNINRGTLFDNGFQITGSAVGQMDIRNGGRIILGKTGFSTLFPTNFIRANIDLNENGQTRYNSTIAQTISSVPVYGRLYLTNRNANPLLANKTLDGAITVNDLLFIDDYNNLIDDGFQITGDGGEEIQMDANSQMTLGTATSATEFPLNMTVFDINEPSTIIYNSGLNQTIKGIAGSGDAQYSNVIVNNAAGSGTPTKTLEGNMIIRGDLTINSNNTVDITAANDFSIELLGNWTNSGTFIEHQGIVRLTGDAAQTIINSSGEEVFHDIIINNSDTGIILEDNISISNAFILIDGIVYDGSDGDEQVTIEDGAVVSGASDNSHVNGIVEKIGTIAFDFPIGKNDHYRPISIGIPTVAATGFRAEYFEEDPDINFDASSLAGTIDHISACEYWILDRTTPGGDATVTLGWTIATSCGITTLADLTLARWDGAVWQDEGSNGSPTGNTSSGTLTSAAAVNSFSPFTIASTTANNPLPIVLLDFNARATDKNTVQLDWQTAVEINNDYFSIERSQNGKDWEQVTTVDGAGNSSIYISYKETDLTPYDGVSFYRLRQTDFDGQFSYSKTVSVNLAQNYNITAFPNPVSSHLTIRNSDGITLEELRIYNQLGQNITTQLKIYSITDQEITFNFNDMAKGIYTIVTETNALKVLNK